MIAIACIRSLPQGSTVSIGVWTAEMTVPEQGEVQLFNVFIVTYVSVTTLFRDFCRADLRAGK